ncbi:hypothetical protein, partial [Escherichia coli]
MNHVVSGLLNKRSEILGIIELKQKEIKELNSQLESLDSTIKIFDSSIDLRTLGGKRVKKKNKYFAHGELTKLILGSLKDNSLSTEELLDKIISSKQLQEERSEILKLIKVALSNLQRDEKVVK